MRAESAMRLGILTSHPIQYQGPWFRELAKLVDLHVYFAHRQTPAQQAAAGYGVAFDWNVNLLDGYEHTFLRNRARHPSTSAFLGCDTPEVGEVVRTTRPDAFLVSGWQLKCYWQAVRACRSAHVPVFVRGDSQLLTQRSLPKRLIKQAVYRVGLAQFDGFLCVGDRNRDYLRHYGAPEHKLLSAPHCVDVGFFRAGAHETAAQKEARRRQLGIREGAFVVMCVGRLVPPKRPLDVVAAVGALRGKLDVDCVFVGDGPLKAELIQAGESLGVRSVFTGFVNQAELPPMYGLADVLVLASTAEETWGLVVNEAMACGVPAIVSSEVGCGPDMIVAGSTGEVYPIGDVTALASAIERVARYRSSERTRAALERTSDEHSCASAAREAVRGIQAVLERRSAEQ